MADQTFHAQILTPEGALFEGVVTGVVLPGSQGRFEVLSRHAPILSTLESGSVVVKIDASTRQTFHITGGFVEVNSNRLTLLAESVVEQA
jgi:F-type H+-transporting ATPase subunit epsilon